MDSKCWSFMSWAACQCLEKKKYATAQGFPQKQKKTHPKKKRSTSTKKNIQFMSWAACQSLEKKKYATAQGFPQKKKNIQKNMPRPKAFHKNKKKLSKKKEAYFHK